MKSKFTLSSGFVVLLLLIATAGRVLAFNLPSEDSISSLYIREGAKQIKNILERREANRVAGVPDDNVYVIDFAEILNTASLQGNTFYENTTDLNESASLPADFKPKTWSVDNHEAIKKHMVDLNADPTLEGTTIIVGLNLYLGNTHTNAQVADYNEEFQVSVLRTQKNTQAILDKYNALFNGVLAALTNGRDKYIVVAGGYYIHKDVNNKDKVRELWGHRKSNSVTQELPIGRITESLKPIARSSVKEKVITYTNSILYFLKGLDQRVINLTQYVSGGQNVTGEELARYDAFFAKLKGIVSDPSRIKVVYYDNDAQLTALEADPRYRGFVDKKNRLDIKIDASGNIILVTAGFLDPPFMNMGGCFDTKENGADAKADQFRQTLINNGADPITRRFLYATYLLYRIVFDTLLCVTDSEHAEATCQGGDGCKFAAGTINGLVEALDIIGSFEGMVDLTSSLMNWAWDFMKNQVTSAYKNVTAPSISAPETAVSAKSLGSSSMGKSVDRMVSGFAGAKKTTSGGTNKIARIGNMMASAYFKLMKVAGPTMRNTYNYGWVAGSVVGMIIDPPSIEGKLATLTTKFGISIISDGKKITSGIINGLDAVEDVIPVSGKPLLKEVDADGTIRRLDIAENGAQIVLDHKELLARAGNLPDVPINLRQSFLDDFAEASESNYDALAKFMTGELDIQDWNILKRNKKPDLCKSAAALSALKKIRSNPKLSQFGVTDDILGSINPSSVFPYDKLLLNLDELIAVLPNSTENLLDYLGPKGFGQQGSAYFTHRHSAVQLQRLLENKSFIQNAETIIFERRFTGANGKISESDVHILLNGGRVLEIETKAGVEFFNGLANSSSNFVRQCENSLQQVTKLEDYKVFLGDAKMTDAKQQVINAWRQGGLLNPESQAYPKIMDYATRKGYSFDIKTIDDYLVENDNWFKEIFTNNFK